MCEKKVSLQTIADRIGVSKYSVSLALNNKPGVSEELRKKIFEVSQEMGYEKVKRKVLPQNLNIVILIPEYIHKDTFFYNDIYWAIERWIQIKGHTAILTSINKQMEKMLMLPVGFAEREIAGVLTVGVLSEAYIKKLKETGVPLISVDQYYDAVNVDVVGTANEEGAFQVVEYLIENGHRDIGFIGSIGMTSSVYERWCGYQKAMLKYNLKINREHCILEGASLETQFGIQTELESFVDKLVSYPTAWFCAADRTAVNLINILVKQGLSVPEDISVAGFDNQAISSISVPALTTYNVKRTDMGKLAVDRILKKIAEPASPTMKTALYGEMVIRESVRRICEKDNKSL